MERISWDRYAGEDIEHLVAMLIYREHERSTNFRPSRGDGGIDIIEPIGNEEYVVYQVKRYSANLTSTQKDAIESSLKRLMEFTKDKTMRIQRWVICMPLAPTPENYEMIRGLSSTYSVPIDWMGLAEIEALLTKYWEVADYYLFGGKKAVSEKEDRLIQLITRAYDFERSGEDGPLNAAELQNVLVNVHDYLNDKDPHYKYELFITEELPPNPTSSLFVTQKRRKIGQNKYAILNIYARCQGSFIERPIRINLNINLEGNEDLKKSLTDFQKYGQSVELPHGTYEFKVDLPMDVPSGFEEEEDQPAKLLIQSPKLAPENRFARNLQAVNGEGTVIAEVTFEMDEVTQGLDGSGIRAFGTSEDGLLEFTTKYDNTSQQMTWGLSCGPIAGRRPDDVLNSLKFLASLHPGTTIRVTRKYGRNNPDTFVTVPEGAPFAEQSHPQYEFARRLSFLQRSTNDDVFIPATSEMADEDWNWIDTACRIMSGEVFGAPFPGGALEPNSQFFAEETLPAMIFFEQPLKGSIAGRDIDLGPTEMAIETKTVEIIPRGDPSNPKYYELKPKDGSILYWTHTFPQDWTPAKLHLPDGSSEELTE